MLPCGNCALKDAENTNLKNDLFINTLIHNYSLTDVIKNVIEEEVRKEIKKVVDTTTEEHLCKLKTCVALTDARIENLVQTDTENDLEMAKKDLERDKKDKMLDKYMEILIQSNSEDDLKKSNGKCEIRQLNEKNDEILSRLTSVEDGLKKLKMEVTEVKMEVTKLKKFVNTSKSGFSKRRGGKIFRAFQAG